MNSHRSTGWPRIRAQLLAISSLLLLAPMAAEAQTGLTIYADGRVLVRRTLPISIPKGTSDQKLPLGPIEQGTVFPLDSTIIFGGATYDAGVDFDAVIRRMFGQKIRFVRDYGRGDTVTAELIGLDPERYRMPNGSIVFGRPGNAIFDPERILLDPTYTVRVTAPTEQKELKVGYFTSAGGWQAAYQVILARDPRAATARVLGQAVIDGGILRLQNVELQLIGGDVGRAIPSPRGNAFRGISGGAAQVGVSSFEDASVAQEESISGVHLYTLPGKTTFAPGALTTVPLFEPTEVKTERLFEVPGTLPWNGGIGQESSDSVTLPVSRIYVLLRPAKSPLGDRPLPAGIVRLFQGDSAGRLQMIGEANVTHTAPGQNVRVITGTAFDLTAKRVQKTFTSRRDSLPGNGWRTTATADYAVRLANGGTEPVTIDVIEQRYGEWSIVSSSIKPEKRSSTRSAFRVLVPAKGETVLTYRVRVVW